MGLTVHCMVKNEEKYIGYALRSVVDFADTILVFDTGSTDSTVSIITELQKIYSNIYFEQKGEVDQKRHTELRQEMIEKTTTDWFMILDGDEIWTKRAMDEASTAMKSESFQCLIAPFYLCVGDLYHSSKKGMYTLNGVVAHATPRFFKNMPGLSWKGKYNEDAVYTKEEKKVFEESGTRVLKEKFWHVTHLKRSERDDDEYSSGSNRKLKRRLTYTYIGVEIPESIPEVFLLQPSEVTKKMSHMQSVKNFIQLLYFKLRHS